MKYSTPCPACGEPVTLGRIIAAPTPWHLKCSKCKSRLVVRWQTPIVVSEVAYAVASAGLIIAFRWGPGVISLENRALIILIVLLFWLLLEVTFGLWVTTKDSLRLPKMK